MIDKLEVLCSEIRSRFRRLAIKDGQRGRGYEQWLDLRDTEAKLSAVLYHRGRHTGINKIEVVNVAKLGLPRTIAIIQEIFPDLRRVRIYRIDCCVDLLGSPVWYFAENCRIPRVQNFRMYRKRGAVSLYLQSSSSRTLVFYDKGRELAARGNPLAAILRPDDCLTRVEVQLRGSGVPIKKLSEIHRYAEINLLENLTFAELRVTRDRQKPIQFLAAVGLRYLIEKHGQQSVSKMFSSPEWAWLKKRFLVPMAEEDLPDLNKLMQRSNADWLSGRIRFPRAPVALEEECADNSRP